MTIKKKIRKKLSSFFFPFVSSRGFTLVELLIVIGIMTLLSTMAILYSRTGERQIILFQEQIKVLNTLSRAKSLSIATFVKYDDTCGFGVHFDGSDNSFRIFRDLGREPDCSDADIQYSGIIEDFEVFELSPFVVFDHLTMSDIIFYPPEPETVIMPGRQEEAIIRLKIIGSDNSIYIKVNDAGMITTQ